MTYRVGTFRAWVLPGYVAGNAFYYPWSLNFIEETRLIPERVTKRASGMGSASFRYLRAWREEGNGTFYDAGYANIGCYVAVTAGVTAFSRSAVIFWGFINQKAITEVMNGVDKTGNVTALGLGYLLDGTQLSGFRAGATGETGSAITTSPTFNIQGDGGVIIGNKVTDATGIPIFADIPYACSPSNLFSRLDILKHVMAYCKPPGVPTLGATGSSAVSTYLNSTTAKEVFDLEKVTLKGAIDLLVSRSNGFGYDIVPNASAGWDVQVYPLIDSAAVYDSTYPVATPVDITVNVGSEESVSYVEDANDLWDAVTVEGDNILVGATVSFADGNLASGWTGTQHEAYRAGATADAGYASLTPTQKVSRNEQLRAASSLADVFQLYTLNLNSPNITRTSSPGAGGASAGPLVPQIEWNGTSVAVGTAYRTPYLPSARFSRSVPWLVGVNGSGTDTRGTADSIARPAYLLPRAWKYDASAATGENVCQDLTAPADKRGSPTISPDENSLGMRVSFNPPEIMAKGYWVDGTDGASRIDFIETDPYARPFPFTQLALTVGIPSDQKVSVTKRRYGVPVGSERRTMIVTDKTIQCWVCLAGTIVGSKSDGSADRVAAHTFIRSDFATAERLAAMYAAFAFRRRTSVSITLAYPDVLPAWAAIGTMVGRVVELSAAGPYPALVADSYTVVEEIDYTLVGRPRVTVSTTLPSPPAGSRGAGGSSSPVGGGSVSQSLGGTVAQAVSATQDRVEEIAAKAIRVPTSVGREGATSGDGASIRESVTVANSFTAGNVVYRNGSAWSKAQANAVATAKYTGVVESATASAFVIVYAGKITLSAAALTPGTTYYLSDLTSGLAVIRGSVTVNQPLVSVYRALTATTAIVMSSRDIGCDLTKLTAGDVASGGGSLRVNGSSVVSVDVSSAGKVTITYASSNTVTIDSADFVGTGRSVKLREFDVCDVYGVSKKALMLSSDLY